MRAQVAETIGGLLPLGDLATSDWEVGTVLASLRALP